MALSLLGIYGGTFDPIHYGHLRPVREIYQTLELSEVRFIPAPRPPHRPTPMASAEDRLTMVRLALEGESAFVLDDCEFKRNAPSYTVDTLRAIHKESGDSTLCLLIGADSLQSLETWHEWEQLFDLCHIIVMARPGYPLDTSSLPWLKSRLCKDKQELNTRPKGCVYICAVKEQPISATAVRKAVAEGKPINDMVPAPVADYITKEKLYY